LIAAGRLRRKRCQVLLDKGADPKARDKDGGTTVIRAAFNGDLQTMKMLIARGVDVNAQAGYDTALANAVNRNHLALVDCYLPAARISER
jgi:ankyrin repeat protein